MTDSPGNWESTAGEAAALVETTIAAVQPADLAAMTQARSHQEDLTKPAGSLGALEEVGVRLAGLAGQCPPPAPHQAAIAVFAADHGVYAQGVTPWPQEVTAQMVANFLAGGAAINVIGRTVGAQVAIVDVGVVSPLPVVSGLINKKVRAGTADFTQGPAMSREEALAAIAVGIQVAQELIAGGANCLITGDMGIANTTASAALIATFTGADPAEATGRGTGIDDETWGRKIAVVTAGLERHQPDPADPIGVVAALGGLEHAALAGLMLAGAAAHIPVIVDGVIAGAAALIAHALAPDVIDALFGGHRSAEPGSGLALAALGVEPLLDLGMRLGEGTGAALAYPLVLAAASIMRDMATFSSAAVDQQ